MASAIRRRTGRCRGVSRLRLGPHPDHSRADPRAGCAASAARPSRPASASGFSHPRFAKRPRLRRFRACRCRPARSTRPSRPQRGSPPADRDGARRGTDEEGVPQIKVVALIGASNLVTDQEVIEAVRQRLSEFRDLPGPQRVEKEKELYTAELRRIIERELILDDMYAKLKKTRPARSDRRDQGVRRKGRRPEPARSARDTGSSTDEEFQMILRSQGLTQPVIRRQIERQIMADEYVRSAIKEKGRAPGLRRHSRLLRRPRRRVQDRRQGEVARHLHQLQQARDAAGRLPTRRQGAHRKPPTGPTSLRS